MGLLDAGTPMDWQEAQQHAAHVRKHGVEQFISLFNHYQHSADAPFLWGDEVEYFVSEVSGGEAKLPLLAPQLLSKLDSDPSTAGTAEGGNGVVWHPEYANWMIEATPSAPYKEGLSDLTEVEANMKLRRSILNSHLQESEALVTMPVFPRLGTEGFVAEGHTPTPEGHVTQSLYIPDESIQPHPRFPTLTGNIRKRREEKVLISVPVFKDLNTHKALDNQAEEIRANRRGEEVLSELPEDSIYMDAMAFGMGAGCLQVTMQARDLKEARNWYDQLAVLAPLMLSLTAASPIWKGLLADVDARWNVISSSVDDRTRGERGLAPLKEGERRIYKSRYSSIDTFISNSELNRPEVNDLPVPVNEELKVRMEAEGIDSVLAQHVAHLFIRDPLVVYHEKLAQDDAKDNDHFENIQSTNWNTVRFKPPPARNPHNIHWRVEFRSMEVNLTDFENAAFSVFMVLLTQAISAKELDLYMPLSQVDENMERAHQRDSVLSSKFFFRAKGANPESKQTEELTLDQIFNGDAAKGVKGLVEVVREFVEEQPGSPHVRSRIHSYLDLVSQRAAGRIPTAASWIRSRVLSHPLYQQDSVVSGAICADIVLEAARMGSLTSSHLPELLGSLADLLQGPAAAASGAATPPPSGVPGEEGSDAQPLSPSASRCSSALATSGSIESLESEASSESSDTCSEGCSVEPEGLEERQPQALPCLSALSAGHSVQGSFCCPSVSCGPSMACC